MNLIVETVLSLGMMGGLMAGFIFCVGFPGLVVWAFCKLLLVVSQSSPTWYQGMRIVSWSIGFWFFLYVMFMGWCAFSLYSSSLAQL